MLTDEEIAELEERETRAARHMTHWDRCWEDHRNCLHLRILAALKHERNEWRALRDAAGEMAQRIVELERERDEARESLARARALWQIDADNLKTLRVEVWGERDALRSQLADAREALDDIAEDKYNEVSLIRRRARAALVKIDGGR